MLPIKVSNHKYFLITLPTIPVLFLALSAKPVITNDDLAKANKQEALESVHSTEGQSNEEMNDGARALPPLSELRDLSEIKASERKGIIDQAISLMIQNPQRYLFIYLSISIFLWGKRKLFGK